MRIALVSPYSWTYPGGVTRHIEALSGELRAQGHDVRILAPFDPDDERARKLHRGARPQPRMPPESFVSLGRTLGIPANGAVSNLSLSPRAVFALRRELREGGYDVVHIHEPVVPVVGWDALCSISGPPLVGTFHTYSENAVTNGIAAVGLGGRRRMNRLHVRIAVSEAAAWTARRFYGGRYRIVPNGVHLLDAAAEGRYTRRSDEPGSGAPLRVLFIGQAVERKGLSVLLRAFEALREQLPATLTLVGASPQEVAHMMLDDRSVQALGKVSEERKLAELARADVVCAPSLHGESFGMVLTEALASATPVVASDIPGYRDVVRDGVEGLLTAPGDPVALGEALRRLAFDRRARERMAVAARERAERFAWPRVAEEVTDCYEEALRIGRAGSTVGRAAVRLGLAPADLKPRIPAERLPSLRSPAPTPVGAERRLRALRRIGVVTSSLAAAGVGAFALQRIGLARVAASLVASKPGLIFAGLGVMCAAMFLRALGWHAILAAAPTWRRARRRDAMQGTFIGVLMSATLPARMGEPSRALIVARRIGRARETLPVVLASMVSQVLLNLLALCVLAGVGLATARPPGTHSSSALLLLALLPLVAYLAALVSRALLAPAGSSSRSRRAAVRARANRSLARLREGLLLMRRRPYPAATAAAAQLAAWALQWLSCWLLLVALGLDTDAAPGAAAAILFAINVTAVMPVTPANIGVFQVACVAVLAAYHISAPEAIAYGIVLQAVEIATALVMGLPALVTEGLSWREVKLRTEHAAPVTLAPLPAAAADLVSGLVSGELAGS